MKPQSSTREPVDKPSEGQTKPVRHDPFGIRASEYGLRVSYYATMKPQRIYPLVVEVAAANSPGAANGVGGTTVVLRPTVPGAIVAPAELPLDVSRPGSRASFHVTPVARGTLPEACVRVFYEGRQVQELRTRMKSKTQRLTWLLLIGAIALPWFLSYWCLTHPMSGMVPTKSAPQAADGGDGPKPANGEKPAQGQKPGGGMMAVPLPPPDEEIERRIATSRMAGTPGEVLGFRLHTGLDDEVPDLGFKAPLIENVSAAARRTYDEMHFWVPHLYIPWWTCLALLFLAFLSWVQHRPTRVRVDRAVALSRVPSGAPRLAAQAGETLPLAPPEDELLQ
jgi:hypothetical protein